MRRGRLARKYLAVLVSLVAGVLAISGAIELRSSYVENKAALVALQREKAGNAAASIEGFVREIERQLVWTTQPSSLTGRAALEERRLDAIRLLRQAPAVTDVSHLDAAGREQVRVSRVDRDDIGSGTDYSTQPKFLEARRGRTWFGPVYFRKESEPYMTIALPQGGGGVTAAEVNLKFIWDVVSQIRIGKTGLAYAVDRTGALIAHPDISLVLQKTSLANLEQVRAALAPNPGGDDITLARDVRGRDVLTAHSRIPSLGWVVFVEQPVQEAFAPVRASAWRIVVLVVLGIAFSAVASVVLARRLARPIQALQESASRIGAGELDHRISIRTGDELEALADQFNEMTGRLRESYATLEQKVEDRTRELREALEQQTATAEILRVISSSPTDVQPVLDAVAESAARLCGATDALIHRVEDGQMLRVAHFGPVPVVAPSPVRPATPGTPSGRAILEARTIHVHDVLAQFARGEYPEARQLQEGSGFRTVLCTPLVRDGVAIGVIVIRRMEVRPFSDAQIALLQTFADQAVIAIENVRLFTELESRNAALTEALDRQTATAEILGVISSSPTDMAPVFETIVRNVVRLCHGWSSALYRYDGELVHNVALTDPSPEAREEYARTFPRRPTLETPIGRVVLSGEIMHIPDVLAEPSLSEVPKRIAQLRGYRGMLMVPMMREGSVVGVIAVSRVEPGLFSDSQVQLVKTFADQAVIAIENVRLFTELEARNAALTESLDQQTATAEILRVISSSPTDVQPVFEAILASATRLCGAEHGILNLYDGEAFTGVAFRGLSAEAEAVFRARGPKPGPMSGIGRMLGAKAPVQVADVTDDPAYRAGDPLRVRTAELLGARTAMWLPLLKGDIVIGAMAIYRREVRPFTDKQVELVTTFADQAVIAIENVRLFKELEAKNAALGESLEQQTATGEILRSISGSPTDVQPVFDTIVRSALRLLDGRTAMVQRVVGDELHLAALTTVSDVADDAVRATFPVPLSRRGPAWYVVEHQRPCVIADIERDPIVTDNMRRTAPLRGYRSLVMVPMVRDERVIGSIGVTRGAPGGFSEDEVELLQTFADQAVIAIENVRLFTELQARTGELTRSVTELEALGEVGRTISSTLDLDRVLETIVARANELAGTDGGAIYEFDAVTRAFNLRATDNFAEHFVAELRSTPLDFGEGAVGRAAAEQRPVQIADVADSSGYESRVRDLLLRSGYRSLLAVPLLSEGEVVGALVVNRRVPGEFPARVVELLRTFATQSALAIGNARLFREIEDKSRQLEAANRHKDEFLASMSHELRTPLNAVIGFSEVLLERMFGELNPKQEEYLNDILASGRHLLSLINDILDLAKIEAGRMELDLEDFDLAQAIDNALVLIRERATRKGLALDTKLDGGLGQVRGDQRKVKQVLLNLLSNAVKFTPEGGRVEVRGQRADGHVEIAVSDTGIGIAPEDQETVFEEFRQVGTDYTKKHEGTGLGLTLSRKFVELHGGRIWLKSQPGHGSTFTFTLPVQAWPTSAS